MVQKSAPIVVIVVEDDALLRMLAVEALEDEGFQVFEAENSKAAINLLERQAKSLHVLFTDVHMPGAMNGLMLAHHTNKHWPWITIIVTSGLAHPKSHELPKGSSFFLKPYHLDEIAGHIRKVA